MYWELQRHGDVRAGGGENGPYPTPEWGAEEYEPNAESPQQGKKPRTHLTDSNKQIKFLQGFQSYFSEGSE